MQDQTSSLDGSGAVFVSPTSTAVLHNCRPLPEDIISLDDSETACQYCGVSYLLLSKYDKMRTHVSKLEADLASLKSYAQLHPALTERAAWLENNLKSARAENEIMKDELASAAEDSGKTIRALHELQLRHTHLTHDYEELLKSEMVVNKLCTSQRRLALEGLIHIKNTLRELHLSLGKMMSALKIESKSILESTVRNLAQALLSHLQLFIDRQVDYRTSALRAKHSLELSQISEELQDAKAELNFCEQKNDHLRKDLEALQEMHDEYAQAHKGKAEDYGKQMVDLESQLATKNSELDEARDSMKELEEQEAALKKRLLELSNLVDQQSKELFQKDQDILETESQLAEERKKFDALQVSMYRASSRSKNEADVKIMNLSNENRRLQDELSKMLSERQKMIDAHQSRLGQLQNKYAEMMREASKGQIQEAVNKITKEMEDEKIQLLAAQKSVFQMQLSEIQAKLQAQIDSVRLSRDQSSAQFQRKIRSMEEDHQSKLDALQQKIEALKTALSDAEARLMAAQQGTKADHAPPTSQTDSAVSQLQTALSRRDSEITFLKETVRLECEERMELIAKLDAIHRGLQTAKESTRASRCDDQPPGGREVIDGSRAGGGRAEPIAEKENGKKGGMNELASPALSSYQSLLAAADIKKRMKLRSAAKKNNVSGDHYRF